MKNTINKNKKIINWKNEFIKIEGLIIYFEKMIKKWKVFMINKKGKCFFWKNIFKFKNLDVNRR